MRVAVDCGGTDPGYVREDAVVRNACGRKPGSHGRLSRESRVTSRGGAITIHCLPTRQHRQLNNREASPSNALCTELQSRTPSRVLL